MGIGRFYRWLSERYPLINEYIKADQVPPFDNLYIDMNGIIHHVSHSNIEGGIQYDCEDGLWVAAFQYVSHLVSVARPRKVLYLAVDGVAPRAKMNQQRARRFRAAQERAAADATEKQMRQDSPDEPDGSTPSPSFDSNCITPGTEFMRCLTENLEYFVQLKVNDDPCWSQLEVILSGPDVPGEGEHKIMDYIRTSKAQPNYNPNTRHCLYGLDADLIMLGLASHEPNFSLLREEILFGKRQSSKPQNRVMSRFEKFQLLHIGLLREYLELEFRLPPPASTDPTAACLSLFSSGDGSGDDGSDCCSDSEERAEDKVMPEALAKVFDIERIIDDFILFCFLAGNDFLPHLPFTEIGSGGLHRIMGVYREYLWSYGPPTAATTDNVGPWLTSNCGNIVWDRLHHFLTLWADFEEEELEAKLSDMAYLDGKRNTGRHRRGSRGEKSEGRGKSSSNNIEHSIKGTQNLPTAGRPLKPHFLSVAKGREDEDILTEDGSISTGLLEEVELAPTAWDPANPPTNTTEAREQFYLRKMGIDLSSAEGQDRKVKLLLLYLEGLQWNLWYYYRGVPSWNWFYASHYPPFVTDLVGLRAFKEAKLSISFSLGKPFRPFEQLMAVLPAKSAELVPEVYRCLMLGGPSGQSEIADFYPEKFIVDMEDVNVPWGGITLIPFIDEERLLSAMHRREVHLSELESKRNHVGDAFSYKRFLSSDADGLSPCYVATPLPRLFKAITQSWVRRLQFVHAAYPDGVTHFPNRVLPGAVVPLPGFPSLRTFPVKAAIFRLGTISVFGTTAKLPGLSVRIASPLCPDFVEIECLAYALRYFNDLLKNGTVLVDYPFQRVAKPVALWFELSGEPQYLRVTLKNKKGPALIPGSSSEYPTLPLLTALSQQTASATRHGIEVTNNPHSSAVIISACLSAEMGSSTVDYKGIGAPSILMEVYLADEVLDTAGGTDVAYRFSNKSEFRCLSLIAPNYRPDKNSNRDSKKCSRIFSAGARVMCTDPSSPLYGALGTVLKTEAHPANVECVFHTSTATFTERWNLQHRLFRLVLEDLQSLKWFDLAEMSQMLKLSESVLSWITRSVFVDAGDREVLDIGFNFVTNLGSSYTKRMKQQQETNSGQRNKSTGKQEATAPAPTEAFQQLCIPGYSMLVPSMRRYQSNPPQMDYKFSELAVLALRRLQEEWPEVIPNLQRFQAQSPVSPLLRPAADPNSGGGSGNSSTPAPGSAEKGPKRAKLSALDLFPKHANPIWKLKTLAKWCKKQPFGRLPLVAGTYACLSPSGIQNLEGVINQVGSQQQGVTVVSIKGAKSVCPIEHYGTLPDCLLAGSTERYRKTGRLQELGQLVLGQRVVYGRWRGVVPFGSQGSVIGTYRDTTTYEQMLELLMDNPDLGCSDLQGRCSRLRGVVCPASVVVALPPLISHDGMGSDAHQIFLHKTQVALQSMTMCGHLPIADVAGPSSRLVPAASNSSPNAASVPPACNEEPHWRGYSNLGTAPCSTTRSAVWTPNFPSIPQQSPLSTGRVSNKTYNQQLQSTVPEQQQSAKSIRHPEQHARSRHQRSPTRNPHTPNNVTPGSTPQAITAAAQILRAIRQPQDNRGGGELKSESWSTIPTVSAGAVESISQRPRNRSIVIRASQATPVAHYPSHEFGNGNQSSYLYQARPGRGRPQQVYVNTPPMRHGPPVLAHIESDGVPYNDGTPHYYNQQYTARARGGQRRGRGPRPLF